MVVTAVGSAVVEAGVLVEATAGGVVVVVLVAVVVGFGGDGNR